ncbi:MAG: sigma-54 dependent transcriptional regulator [Desulfovibrionaceae bacterium]|nr:sigma-54 dependent transcriptional regulator [Desulfovibrionaceae bacterium]
MEAEHSTIIGQSSLVREVFSLLRKVAPTECTVLITGESGTGKELFVRALHQQSKRASMPFVPINCGAIPRELLESELFGHEKGAFTHALRAYPGRFEQADGGTIFLDEIGEMDIALQVKILRVLQEKVIERVGGVGGKKIDVRLVAATSRNLAADVAAGRFREDLFYRLNVIPVHLPPLRERGEDILLLASHFLQFFCKREGRAVLRLSPEVQALLMAYAWPGNVRELENCMERLSVLTEGALVQVHDLPLAMQGKRAGQPAAPAAVPDFVPPTVQQLAATGMTLKDFLESMENSLIDAALAQAGGIKNQAAAFLGIKRTTLIEKLKKRQA